jgi:hypothetical protein
LGKFGKTDDPKGDKVVDEAQLDELLKFSESMKRANGTVRLGLDSVPLERVPMGKEEMAEARKRFDFSDASFSI